LSHGTHVVNAKNGGPVRHCDEACCNGTAETVLWGDWIQRGHERFSTRSQHHSGSGSTELAEAAKELQALPSVLREPEAWVEQDMGALDACREGSVPRLGPLGEHVLDEVAVAVGRVIGESAHRAQGPAHMHQDEVGPVVRDGASELRVREARNVVDHRCTPAKRPSRDLGARGIHAENGALGHGPFERGPESVDLRRGRDGFGPGAGRLGAQIDDLCSFSQELVHAPYGRFLAEKAPPIEERVRRDVEDSHQRGPALLDGSVNYFIDSPHLIRLASGVSWRKSAARPFLLPEPWSNPCT
jgi:hypothetical protein